MTYIPEEPPDQNEAYENLDESLDEQDLPGHGPGPQGRRELDADIVADRRALHEAGADLDDPDRISLLDGGMDDPDGSTATSGRRTQELDDDHDPEEGAGPEGEGGYGDSQLEFVEVDPNDMDQVPEDAPGPDSARW